MPEQYSSLALLFRSGPKGDVAFGKSGDLGVAESVTTAQMSMAPAIRQIAPVGSDILARSFNRASNASLELSTN